MGNKQREYQCIHHGTHIILYLRTRCCEGKQHYAINIAFMKNNTKMLLYEFLLAKTLIFCFPFIYVVPAINNSKDIKGTLTNYTRKKKTISGKQG